MCTVGFVQLGFKARGENSALSVVLTVALRGAKRTPMTLKFRLYTAAMGLLPDT